MPVEEPRPDLVEVVARALHEHSGAPEWRAERNCFQWICACGFDSLPLYDTADAEADGERHVGRKLLAALSSIGALMPDGGQTREECRVVCDHRGETAVWSSDQTLEQARPSLVEASGDGNRWPNARIQRQAVTTYPDGSAYISAWTETTDDAHS